jgi:hypothetical protein
MNVHVHSLLAILLIYIIHKIIEVVNRSCQYYAAKEALPVGSAPFVDDARSVAAAAEDKQCDDEHPNPIIAKKMAQTAVIHKSTSVVIICEKVVTVPRIIIL